MLRSTGLLVMCALAAGTGVTAAVALGRSSSHPAATLTATETTPPPVVVTTPDPHPQRSRILARTGRLSRGRSLVLLHVPEVGTVRVTCDHHGRPSAVFTKDRTMGASSDATISSGTGEPRSQYLRRGGEVVPLPNPGGPGAFDTLRLAEVAEGGALVTTITVALAPVHDAPLACSASAQSTSTDAGTTLAP